MRSVKKYPKLKIIVGFSLCPMFPGMIIGLIIENLMSNKNNEIIINFENYLRMSLVVGFVGEIFFFVPAFFLAIFIASKQIKKGICSIFFITILGGLGAGFWGGAVLSLDMIREPIFGDTPIKHLFHSYFFLLGASASLIMAIFILPKRTTDSKPKCNV